MSDKIIKPTFGGPKEPPPPAPPPPPPPPPPTYDELLFKVEQQADMIRHLKNMLITRDEDYKRAQEGFNQAQRQLKALVEFCGEGAKVLEMSKKNLEVISHIIPKPPK